MFIALVGLVEERRSEEKAGEKGPQSRQTPTIRISVPGWPAL